MGPTTGLHSLVSPRAPRNWVLIANTDKNETSLKEGPNARDIPAADKLTIGSALAFSGNQCHRFPSLGLSADSDPWASTWPDPVAAWKDWEFGCFLLLSGWWTVVAVYHGASTGVGPHECRHRPSQGAGPVLGTRKIKPCQSCSGSAFVLGLR